VSVSIDACVPIQRADLLRIEAKLDQEYYSFLKDADRELALQLLALPSCAGVESDRPYILFSAGGMSSGKTSTFERLRQLQLLPMGSQILDPDDMKALIPGYSEAAAKKDENAGTNYHRLSMYLVDILSGWYLERGVSHAYMTSLRHLPSAQVFIDRIRRDHPRYRVGVIYVRAPDATLLARNQARFERTGRKVPVDLVTSSAAAADANVRLLETSADLFLSVTNDENRDPYVGYWCSNQICRSTDIPLVDSEPRLASLRKVLSNELPKEDSPRLIDLVLDWDWSVSYWLAGEESTSHDHPIIPHQGKNYRLVDGFQEFMEVILRLNKFRTSFFSGGEVSRNEEVIRRVKLLDDSLLYERVYRILSKSHLTTVSEDPNLKFPYRYKKDLRSVSPSINLEQTLLVDDQREFALDSSQQKNILWLQDTYNYVENYTTPQEVAKLGLRIPPPSRKAWALERNKLAWVLGVILEALHLQEVQQIKFVDAVHLLTHDREGNLIPRESQLRFYRRGIAAMNGVRPGWMKVSLHEYLGEHPCPLATLNLVLNR